MAGPPRGQNCTKTAQLPQLWRDRGPSNRLQVLIEEVGVDVEGHGRGGVAKHPLYRLTFAPALKVSELAERGATPRNEKRGGLNEASPPLGRRLVREVRAVRPPEKSASRDLHRRSAHGLVVEILVLKGERIGGFPVGAHREDGALEAAKNGALLNRVQVPLDLAQCR